LRLRAARAGGEKRGHEGGDDEALGRLGTLAVRSTTTTEWYEGRHRDAAEQALRPGQDAADLAIP
jgi:hypothetical protein